MNASLVTPTRFIGGLKIRRATASVVRSIPVTILIALIPSLHASTVMLTVSGCTVGCTTSPFGMVSLLPNVDGVSVDITVILDSDANGPYHFHDAPDTHHFALAFDITGSPSVTIGNLTSGFSAAGTIPGSYSPSPFGTLDYAFQCTGCGPGYAGGLTGPLQLTVTPSVGALTPDSFFPAGAAHFFTVDIVDFVGNGGNVSDTGDPAPDPTPEPATMLLLGSALIMLSIAGRHRR